MEATLVKRNDGGIWDPDYDPDDDPEIIRLRELADKHPWGELTELPDEDWLILLDNDVPTLYKLRGDEHGSENPHGLRFPGDRDLLTIHYDQYEKPDWLRLLKWDVTAFNEQYNQWYKAAKKDEKGRIIEKLDLKQGYFVGAYLSLAYLEDIDLGRSNLAGADLRYADLSKADLNSVDLSAANLTEAKLINAVLLNANLSVALLDKANLSRAILSKADMPSASLSKANLSNAYLLKATLVGARLGEANLEGAHLEEAELPTALLNLANLTRANLSKANLSNAFLFEANLTGARFEETNLRGTHLGQAILHGADFTQAKMAYADLAGAKIDDTTKFDPSSLRGADCRKIHFINRNFANFNDAVDVDFDGCRFQRAYFRSSLLGKIMIREKAYEWGLMARRKKKLQKKISKYEIDTSADEKYMKIFKGESTPRYSELAKVIQQAGESYLNLKANWQDIGFYDDASWASVREKECERKASYALLMAELHHELDDEARAEFNNKRSIKRHTFIYANLLKWVGYSIFNALCQYGENPLRLAYWAAGLILVFAFIYPISGIAGDISDHSGSTGPQETILNYSLGSTPGNTLVNAGRFLYYSVITFTTVGYGDFHPVGAISHLLAMIEAFCGVFLVGLFIWCLGRRVGAR